MGGSIDSYEARRAQGEELMRIDSLLISTRI
jgi:hypothetical protein